jgi:hypothetical protein
VGLTLLLLLVVAGLVVLVTVGAFVLQGYFYTEPTDGLAWRAPLAGALAGLVVVGWCLLDLKMPGRFDTLTSFSAQERRDVDRFDAVLRGRDGKEKTLAYHKVSGPRGQAEFQDPNGTPFRRSTADAMVTGIVVDDGGKPVRFNAVTDKQGRFENPIRWVEEGGSRYMNEGPLGTVFAYRKSLLFGNLLLNLLHFVVWFLVLWLVVRFAPSHALGLGAGMWALVTFAVLPILFERTRSAPRPPAPKAALPGPAGYNARRGEPCASC